MLIQVEVHFSGRGTEIHFSSDLLMAAEGGTLTSELFLRGVPNSSPSVTFSSPTSVGGQAPFNKWEGDGKGEGGEVLNQLMCAPQPLGSPPPSANTGVDNWTINLPQTTGLRGMEGSE